MKYFAETDANNVVLRVLVIADEQEHRGQLFLSEDLGFGGTWIQTSPDGSFRKNFAGVGFIFESGLDAFIPAKPFDSWVLNDFTCLWQAPISYPDNGQRYSWDEPLGNWVVFG